MSGGDVARFGKYRLLRRIAAGGMGEVHLAKLIGPQGFEKLVVIKRLLDHRKHEQKYIDMFFSEARVAAQLNHSNIVQIYEVGNYEGTHYIAMEYVPGKSLRHIIDSSRQHHGTLHEHYVVQIMIQLSLGLAFAHDARHLSGAPMDLIHRDINPHNILVSYRGEVKIIDFGIAKSELTLEHTKTGMIKGTVVYMSPEQSSGQKLDRRSDIFSVGICLYEALTGTNPFHKDSLTGSLEAIRQAGYPPLAGVRPDAASLAPIVDRALARLPDLRYSNGIELADALQDLLDNGRVVKAPVPLGIYLHRLFASDILEEERLLSQTELADIPLLNETHTLADVPNNLTPQALSIDDETVMENRSSSFSAARMSPLAPNDPAAFPEPLVPRALEVSQSSNRVVRDWRALLRQLSRPPWIYGLTIGFLLAAAPLLWWASRPKPLPEMPHTSLPVPQTAPRITGEKTLDPTGKPEPHELDAAIPEPAKPVAPQPDVPPTEPVDGRRSPAARRPPAPATRHHPKTRRAEAAASEVGPVGGLAIVAEPGMRMTLNGATINQAVKLKASTGTITFGTKDALQHDGFTGRLHYRVDQKGILFAMETDPWANVYGAGGIALGRTPLDNVQGGNTTVFELRNPKVSTTQRFTVRFTAP